MISADTLQTLFAGTGAVSQIGDNDNVLASNSQESKADFGQFLNNQAQNDVVIDKSSDEINEKVQILFASNTSESKNQITQLEDVSLIADRIIEASMNMICQNVVDIISDNTGYSVDEIQTVMAQNNISNEDLIEADNIKNLFMNLENIDDAAQLLTNQDVYNQLTDILNQTDEMKDNMINQLMTPSVEEVNSELKVDTEGNNAVDIRSVFDEQNNKLMPENGDLDGNADDVENVTQDNTSVDNSNEELNANIVTTDNSGETAQLENVDDINNKDSKVQELFEKGSHDSLNELKQIDNETDTLSALHNIKELHDDKDDAGNSDDSNDIEISQTQSSDDQSIQKMLSRQNDSDSFSNDLKDNSENMTQSNHQSESKTTNINQFIDNLFTHVRETVGQESTGQVNDNLFAQRIMNHVVDALKVISKENVTSMEMQLNPESLGKINIQVVAKDGLITAQIVAQNEQVKESIENQLTVLKQNMADQDIKIDDVEVTVSSHAFEQNMDNGASEDNQKQNKKKNYKGQGLAGLNEADLKDIKDEILEETMMEQNGSTVSYTA